MNHKPQILFATPEAYPLVKTGGLGDVAGALPPALQHLGADVRILLPAYGGVIEKAHAEPLGDPLPTIPGFPTTQLFRGAMPDSRIPVYLLHCPELYERDGGPYVDNQGEVWPDNPRRFGLLSMIAARFGDGDGFDGWRPQLIHCNDWQTGLVPAYLSLLPEPRPRSIISVHNISFQGNFPKKWVPELGLPWELFTVDGLEFYDQLSFLKAGLSYANRITTVSPTYAREIQSSEYGCMLEGLLSQRNDDLIGILNGIDTWIWSPETDRFIPQTYGPSDLAPKVSNKRALQQQIGLAEEAEPPLIGMVTRLTEQKGVDLLPAIIDELLQQGAQLAILGSGVKELEEALRKLAAANPGQVGIRIGYDERLAHLIEAGADLFLMPSRFEPCGLNQMYSMRYGTPPIVRHTGGLADSVEDAGDGPIAEGGATGFVFQNADPDELMGCLSRAIKAYTDKQKWQRIQLNGMARDFSWKSRAIHYLELYRSIIEK